MQLAFAFLMAMAFVCLAAAAAQGLDDALGSAVADSGHRVALESARVVHQVVAEGARVGRPLHFRAYPRRGPIHRPAGAPRSLQESVGQQVAPAGTPRSLQPLGQQVAPTGAPRSLQSLSQQVAPAGTPRFLELLNPQVAPVSNAVRIREPDDNGGATAREKPESETETEARLESEAEVEADEKSGTTFEADEESETRAEAEAESETRAASGSEEEEVTSLPPTGRRGDAALPPPSERRHAWKPARSFIPHMYLPSMTEPANDVVNISVACDMRRDAMTVTVRFQRDFDGLLYAKGYFKVGTCRHAAPPSPLQRFDISLDECGMQQKSSTDDFGGTTSFSNTVVVMNAREWGILGAWDRAYKVTCDSSDNQAKMVDYALGVPSDLHAVKVAGQVTMPACHMKVVRGDDPLRPGAAELTLGDLATMVAYVRGREFDVSIFDCRAHDGTPAGSVDLLDLAGCPARAGIVGEQRRGGAATTDALVFAHFTAFKFPDVDTVVFECRCRVCAESCLRPQCSSRSSSSSSSSSRRRRRKRSSSSSSSSSRRRRETDKDASVLGVARISKSLNVRLPGEASGAEAGASDSSVCESLTVIMIIVVTVAIVVVAAATALYRTQRRELARVGAKYRENLAVNGNMLQLDTL